MRLLLSLLALTWAPAFAQFGCTICKGGVGFLNPSGRVTTGEGLTLSCVDLISSVSSLSGDACVDLQYRAAEPCNCPGWEEMATQVIQPEVMSESIDPALLAVYPELLSESSGSSELSQSLSVASESASPFVCSICSGGEMKNPTAYTLNTYGVPTSCQELHDTRETISESDCARIQSFAATACGCDGGNAPTTIDAFIEEDSETFTCNLCGDGVIGNPDGMVVNNRGVGRTCAELEANKANIPLSMCPALQNTALEPCECVFGQEATTVNSSQENTGQVPLYTIPPYIPPTEDEAAPLYTIPPYIPPTQDEAVEPNEVLEVEVLSQCSICGDGEITIPDGVVTTPNGSSARCDILDSNPTEITTRACSNIQALARQPCGCVFPFGGTNTEILNDIAPYECSICGEGAVTIPDGIVTTPAGQSARCSSLEANAISIPEEICPEIQQLTNIPCGCTNSETASAGDEPEVCHVCGGPAALVGNPSNMVTTPSGMFTCYSVFNAGLDGAISTKECGAVQAEVAEKCGCYVETPTAAPSDIYKCPICGDGLYVTQPDNVLNTENGMTCGQYRDEAQKGRVDEDQCAVLQGMSGVCGCLPPPTFPTEAPTSFECEVCGRGREIGLPDAEVMLPNYQKMSCAVLQDRAATGLIHSSQCARYVPIAQQYCGCKDKPYTAPPKPTESYYCDICGEGRQVTNPSGVVGIPTRPDRTCTDLMTEAAYGKISESQCSLLQPFVQHPCGCENPNGSDYSTEDLEEDGDCFRDLGKIQALERAVEDTSVTRTYNLCPDTTFDIGVWTEEGEIIDGQPFIALRPNVIYQCGSDGSRANECILKGGDFGLASYKEVYDGIHESVPGVEIKGLIFESQNLFSVLLKSAGDITFTGCAFVGNSNNVPVLMQYEGEEENILENRRLEEFAWESEDELKQVVTFQDCIFRDNIVDDSLSFPGIIENSFNSELIVKNCLFEDNVYGSSNNPAGSGYAIRSFGPVTLESTCFIDNTFLDNGPVLVYGAQFSSNDNYVQSSQTDLTCELGALFSSQDDMLETTPSCVSSDASTCSFSYGPTLTSSTSAPRPTSTNANQASSSAVSVTGRQLSMIGVTVLPMLLALSLSVLDL